MTLEEFNDRGYRILAQEPVYETHPVSLKPNKTLEDCTYDEVINRYSSNEQKTYYDILDPSGDLISPYRPTLFTTEDVLDFIHNLKED